MKTLKHLLILLYCCCLSPILLAIPVQHIFTANIPVANRSNSTLNKALPTALSNVLIKLSGNPGVITLPNIQPALKQASKLVKSYSFQQPASSPADEDSLVLNVSFDKQGVQKLLYDNQQPIWSVNRPLTLIWITNPQQPHQLGLSANDQNKMTAAIKEAANYRGLPIIFPIMDLTDESLMNSLSKSGKFEQKSLEKAKQRYHADAILAGRINFNADHSWQVQWRFIFNNQPLEWATNGQTIATAISSGINQAANLVASQQAVLDNKDLQNTLSIKVSNINNLMDYAQLKKYLNTINLVNSIKIINMNNSTVVFTLNVAGNEQELNNKILQSKKLIPVTNPSYGNDGKIDLFYQWQNTNNTPATPQPYATNSTDHTAAQSSALINKLMK